ncbi:MAG TPA: hypothetical protein VHS09_13955, partial [Polyangiaceae bacterium]|nr:hypothetical protein [Polyangiaceae bacterium]
MSALVDRALDAAGLSAFLEARCTDRLDAGDIERLHRADLLALGALADRVRASEVGDEVRIFTQTAAEDAGAVVLPRMKADVTGLELLREVAIARITGPRAGRVRVDWTRAGLELAQVALGFGANELCGFIANKRGLPMAEGEMLGVVGKKSRL